MVWAFGQDSSWTSPWGGVSSMPIQEETPGAEQGHAVEIISLNRLGNVLLSHGKVNERGKGEELLDLPARTAASATWIRGKIKRNKTKQNKKYTKRKKRAPSGLKFFLLYPEDELSISLFLLFLTSCRSFVAFFVMLSSSSLMEQL